MNLRQEFLEELDVARQKMLDALAKLDRNKEIYPHWTIKEMLAHITGWDDATIASLQAHMAGDVPVTPAARGINYYNARTVTERESLPYEHISREWERSREILKNIILEMPEEKFNQPLVFPWGMTGTVAQIIEIFAEHEEEHAQDIEKLISDAKS